MSLRMRRPFRFKDLLCEVRKTLEKNLWMPQVMLIMSYVLW